MKLYYFQRLLTCFAYFNNAIKNTLRRKIALPHFIGDNF